MTTYQWTIPVNPEPWAVGPLGTMNKGGKRLPYVGPNLQLQNFQESVRWHLARSGGPKSPITDECELRFLFWRRIDQYETAAGRMASANYVDATNLQKATEDALQPTVIKNDRQVRRVTSEIIQQGPGVTPGIYVVLITPYVPSTVSQYILDQMVVEDTTDNSADLGNVF